MSASHPGQRHRAAIQNVVRTDCFRVLLGARAHAHGAGSKSVRVRVLGAVLRWLIKKGTRARIWHQCHSPLPYHYRRWWKSCQEYGTGGGRWGAGGNRGSTGCLTRESVAHDARCSCSSGTEPAVGSKEDLPEFYRGGFQQVTSYCRAFYCGASG